MIPEKTPIRCHPVRVNGRQFICRYTVGHYNTCRQIMAEWAEGTTWEGRWGAPWDVDVWLSGHYDRYHFTSEKHHERL